MALPSPFSRTGIGCPGPLAVALALWIAVSGFGQQPADEMIDWTRARELHQRVQRGEELSPDEQAYYVRAREQRQRNGGANTGGRQKPAAPPPAPTNLVPLTELGLGQYQGVTGGLYGQGTNHPPAAHEAAAKAAAQAIRPLAANGTPAPDGRIALLSIGMSNTTQEYAEFVRLAEADPEKAPQVTVVDGAQGSQDAVKIADASAPFWAKVDERLKQGQVSREQVQAIWLKEAIIQPRAAFPSEVKRLEALLAKIVVICKVRFPNLRLIFLSSRTYGGYAQTTLNPEPHAYESAFAVRGLIERQIAGDGELNHDPELGAVAAPVLLWGPYLWANGDNPRPGDGLRWEKTDFAGDGTHPAPSGRQKVGRLLLDFFKTNPMAAPWFKRSSVPPTGALPAPTVAGAAYGLDERNRLDFWAAPGRAAAPVLIFYHGGGFRAGDKSDVPPALVQQCLEAGIAVVSANYRLSNRHIFPAFMTDGARVVQFIRLKAAEWNLDPARIAASGASAGGGISLWVGFHDDLAKPQSVDPVERQSSRLSAMAVINAQTSYAIPAIVKIAGPAAARHPALQGFYGLSVEEFDREEYPARVLRDFEEASPINHLSVDDPPAFLYYKEARAEFGPGAKAGAGIHSPKFGTHLKERADQLGVRVVLRHRDEFGANADSQAFAEMAAFLTGVFAGTAKPVFE